MATPLELLPKLLRMFSSDHDGEVAAAARKAHTIMVTNNWDWGKYNGERIGGNAHRRQKHGYPRCRPA